MSESKAHHIEIRDVDGQTLLKLVDYIYTAEIEVSEDNVQVSRTVCSPPIHSLFFPLPFSCACCCCEGQGISSYY